MDEQEIPESFQKKKKLFCFLIILIKEENIKNFHLRNAFTFFSIKGCLTDHIVKEILYIQKRGHLELELELILQMPLSPLP